MTKQYDIEDICVKDNDLFPEEIDKIVQLCNDKGANFWKDGKSYLRTTCDLRGFTYLEKNKDGFWDVNGFIGGSLGKEIVDGKTWVSVAMKTLEA